MDNTNEYYTDNGYKELEDIDLPPLSPMSYLEPHKDTIDNSLSPLPINDSQYAISTYEEDESKESQTYILPKYVETARNIINPINEETKKVDELKESLYHTCCACNRNIPMNEMFSLGLNIVTSDSRLICLCCAVDNEEGSILHDWTLDVECDEKRYCSRCRKEKPCYKFTENNKYCDYCLIRKRFLRLKRKKEEKIMNEEEESISNSSCSGNSSDDSYEKNNKRKVKCCKCNKFVNISETFLLSKDRYSFSDKHICLYCSLDISNYHLLYDWEDNVNHDCGKMCSRCKKIKSFSRFRVGHLSCEYCSLKRKRQYLLTRK